MLVGGRRAGHLARDPYRVMAEVVGVMLMVLVFLLLVGILLRDEDLAVGSRLWPLRLAGAATHGDTVPSPSSFSSLETALRIYERANEFTRRLVTVSGRAPLPGR